MIGVILALIAARIYIKTPDGRYNWHSLLMKIPVVKKLIENTNAARFSRTLGTLTATGVPLGRPWGSPAAWWATPWRKRPSTRSRRM